MSSINETPCQAGSELELLRAEVQRLKRVVVALMDGCSTIAEVNIRTGETGFIRTDASLSDRLGAAGALPSYDDLLALLIRHGVSEADQPAVRTLLSRHSLAEQLKRAGGVTHGYRSARGGYGEVRVVRVDGDFALLGFSEKDREIAGGDDQIYTDSLTGVKNRRYCDEHLANQSCQALVMSDVDAFARINDTYGSLCGDQALSGVADRLQASVRGEDCVIRYDGDAFLIAFKTITRDALRMRLEAMRRAVEAVRLSDYPQVHLTMSFGALYGDGLIRDMIPGADMLLNEARRGRNAVMIKPFGNGGAR